MQDERGSTPANPPPTEDADQIRAVLLDAAARVFAAKGYAGSSVEEIAMAAGLPVEALHAHFDSRESLLVEVLNSRLDERIAEATWLVETGATSRADAAAAMSRLFVVVADKDADSVQLQAELWLYAVRHPEMMERLTARARAIDRAVGEAVRARLDPGVEVSVEEMATVLSALFEGLVRRRRTDPAAVSDELFGRALQWLIAGVRAVHGPR